MGQKDSTFVERFEHYGPTCPRKIAWQGLFEKSIETVKNRESIRKKQTFTEDGKGIVVKGCPFL